MVEGEPFEGRRLGALDGQVRHRPPAGRGRVRPGDRLGQVGGEGDVRDRDDAHAGVAVWLGVGRQLLQVEAGLDAGLLDELPRGGGGGVLVGLDKAAGEGPGPGKRIVPALDEQDVQGPGSDGEDAEIDRDGEGRVAHGFLW